MNKAQQRVAIAQDALAWIEAGALEPDTGVYLDPTVSRNDIFTPENIGKQLRDVMLGKCHVCAKGALFLAKAVRFNQVKLPYTMNGLCNLVSDHKRDNAPLREHFSQEQLVLIEKTYEGWGYQDWKLSERNFYSRYPDIRDRLIAILKNIIKNNGTFDPGRDF